LNDSVVANPPPIFTWGYLDSLLGRIYLAATPLGVCSASYTVPDEATFLREVRAELGDAAPCYDPAAPIVVQALAELEEYLAGARRAFTVPVDLCRVRGAFLCRALEALRAVPYGHLVSYGELARRAGQPRAARAAGAACKANPIVILVPCHRVVHAAGDLGGWSGGPLWHKRVLLELEGVRFDPDGEPSTRGRRPPAAPR
jgi:methylated-DNA-[protein]-cysteine S-methyltransferase